MNSSHNVIGSYQGLTNSFQELMDSLQETLCDETCNEMCDEIYDEMYDEMYDKTYKVHDEMHKTYKGQDLVGINSTLPHINKAIVFAISDTFLNWSIAEHYCEFSGTYQPKKTNNLQNQHNKVNLSCATGVVHITSFNDKHIEHQLLPDIKIFAPVNYQFSDNCHKEICYLAVN
ncbi:10053_t:CDS:2, partial [Racocetra fulgida]